MDRYFLPWAYAKVGELTIVEIEWETSKGHSMVGLDILS